MATHCLPDLDSRFLADNLLDDDDWGVGELECGEIEDLDQILDSLRQEMELGEEIKFDLDSIPVDVSGPWAGIYQQVFAETEVKCEPPSPPTVQIKTEAPLTPPYCHGDLLTPPMITQPATNLKIELQPTNVSRDVTKGIALTPHGVVMTNGTNGTNGVKGIVIPSANGPKKVAVPANLNVGASISTVRGDKLLESVPPLSASGALKRLGDVIANTRATKTLLIQTVSSQPAQHNGASPMALESQSPHNLVIHSVPAVSSTPSCANPVTIATASLTTTPKPIIPSPATHSTTSSQADPRFIKRQQRMIKNRESACLSRRKKKEYLQGLENQLQTALSENVALRDENVRLRQQLHSLTASNGQLKEGSMKKGVCLAVFLLCVLITCKPFGLIDPGGSRSEVMVLHPGRRLLGYSSEDGQNIVESIVRSSSSDEDYRRGLVVHRAPKRHVEEKLSLVIPPAACPPHNHSHSLRVAGVLRGLAAQQDKRRNQTENRRPFRHPMRKVMRKYFNSVHTSERTQLQVYQGSGSSHYDFLDLVGTESDTFYFVSFHRDHLLLPASSHNKTRRPRMAIMVPASRNASRPPTAPPYEPMVRVECEVTDARLLFVRSASVPASLRGAAAEGETAGGGVWGEIRREEGL
uniref:cyclic AMP-dependent transcription factor ATF-6 beta-like isoform X2 n=1 Tax=Myxine glutinosa TaxID=7769 RepID=UPI00358E2F74